jgi:hypothetical protein
VKVPTAVFYPLFWAARKRHEKRVARADLANANLAGALYPTGAVPASWKRGEGGRLSREAAP